MGEQHLKDWEIPDDEYPSPDNKPQVEISDDNRLVEIKGNGKRYVVYFNKAHYVVFIGRKEEGTLITISSPDSIHSDLSYEDGVSQ